MARCLPFSTSASFARFKDSAVTASAALAYGYNQKIVHKEEKRRLAEAMITMARVVVEKTRKIGGKSCVSSNPGCLNLIGTSPDSTTELVHLGKELSVGRFAGEGCGGFESEEASCVRVVVTDGMLRERLGAGAVVGRGWYG